MGKPNQIHKAHARVWAGIPEKMQHIFCDIAGVVHQSAFLNFDKQQRTAVFYALESVANYSCLMAEAELEVLCGSVANFELAAALQKENPELIYEPIGH